MRTVRNVRARSSRISIISHESYSNRQDFNSCHSFIYPENHSNTNAHKCTLEHQRTPTAGTHAGFPGDSAKRFCKDGDRHVFEKFVVTNSNPTAIARLPDKTVDSTGVFMVLDLLELFVKDL